MNLSGLADLKTTIPGLIIIIGATIALLTGKCSFEQWWTVVLAAIALVGGGGLLLAGGKKKENP